MEFTGKHRRLPWWGLGILLACSFGCGTQTADSPAAVSLNGRWKIAAGDDRAFASPGCDDRAWDEITLPGSFIGYLEKKGKPAAGTVWLRRRFPAAAAWKRDGAGLILGTIGNADQAFVNGVLVGSTGGFPPEEAALWNQARRYFLPAGVLSDENVIALRVSCSVFGEVLGDLAVAGEREWRRSRDLAFVILVLNYAVIALCAAIGFIFLLIYLRRRSWSEYRWFLLQLIPGFFVVYEICGAVPLPGGIVFRVKLLGFMWSLLVVFQLGFLHRLYGMRRPRVEALLWILLAINTALIAYASDFPRHRWIALFVILTEGPLALYNISVHLVALGRGNGNARFLTVPGIILSLGAAHDGVVYLGKALGRDLRLGGYSFDTIIIGYCAAMMFIVGAWILVHRFMDAMDQVEDLNRNLETRVRERTAELQQRMKELSTMVDALHLDRRVKTRTELTPQTGEKIRNAIVYIHENFMFDISREGLAAHVGLNPDTMGKAFRVFTGSKFQDYINDLRVRSAALLLRETDRKIVDIAFESGFESLRTFNRAFTRFMKRTPNEYRKDNSGPR